MRINETCYFLAFSLYINFLFSLDAVIFTDVTNEAGLVFKHQDGRSGRFYFLEELGSGAAFFDYDNEMILISILSIVLIFPGTILFKYQ